jgi:hypothetical protein
VPEPSTPELPFRVDFDPKRGAVLQLTYGKPPRLTTRRTVLFSLEALAIRIAEHQHESHLHQLLADELRRAAIEHFAADPQCLEAAVQALSDPTSTTPLGALLHTTRAQASAQ